MRAAFLIGALMFMVACSPTSPDVDLCEEERVQFTQLTEKLEVAVSNFETQSAAMKARIDGGESVSDSEWAEFETMRTDFEQTLFDGQEEGSKLRARIDAGCQD